MSKSVGTLYDFAPSDIVVLEAGSPDAAQPQADAAPDSLSLDVALLSLHDRASEQAGDDAEAGTSSHARPSATCRACGLASSLGWGPAEQRAHFREDWHRFNVRRRVAGQGSVSREEFERLAESGDADQVGSLSGSASEAESDEGAGEKGGTRWSGALFAFCTRDDRRLLAWKAYLDSPAAPPASLPSQLPSLLRSARRCAVVLYRGNHFSAAVFEVHPSRVADASQEEKFEALAHKSLHRYV
ncbi:hypothetical protein H632_c3326p0, partial [Helicosporidium sp. ATCC 50920]